MCAVSVSLLSLLFPLSSLLLHLCQTRFSKDQDVLDNSLPHVIQDCFECGVIVVCSIGLICIITPLFILPLIGLSMFAPSPSIPFSHPIYFLLVHLFIYFLTVFLYYNVQKFYRKSNREIKRLESISRSPVSSLVSVSSLLLLHYSL